MAWVLRIFLTGLMTAGLLAVNVFSIDAACAEPQARAAQAVAAAPTPAVLLAAGLVLALAAALALAPLLAGDASASGVKLAGR